jgi:hypothetical protein
MFIDELRAMVATHPPTDQCQDMECLVCGVRDCPDGEPLHYHHDGCPACWTPPNENASTDLATDY